MENALIGYSKGLYATWFYYKPARLLLDAGEGVIHGLGKRIFGIRKVFLTHGHEDHISGLPSLVNLRNLSNGDREIPIEVYYPEGDPFIRYLREYLDKKQKHRLQYRLDWHPIRPGSETEIDITRRSTRMRAFAVEHTRGWQSLGYRLEEKRQALKPEFAGLEPDAVKLAVADQGKAAVLDTVWHPVLVYTGDTRPVADVTECRGADLLLIDSTFIDAKDTAGSRHSHIEASFRTAAEAGVRHLVLMHLSGRYSKQETQTAISDAIEKHGRPPRLGYFFESRYYEIAGEAVPGSTARKGA
jgi:ribonuclease Z